MPIGASPLSADQYQLMQDWIANGARNHKDELRFPDLANRRKWYVGNQGCDLVSVFDAESRQIMRYVQVGQVPGLAESPHMIRVSKDKAHWYVIFLAANPYIEKYSTLTDKLEKRIYIGSGDWNTFNISPDGKFGFAVAYNSSSVAVVDLERDTLAIPLIVLPNKIHGAAVHPNQNRLYVTLQDESGLFVLDYDANGDILSLDNVDLVQNQQPPNPGPLWPHELIFTPDGSKYFVSCQNSKEVRVLDGATNTLLDVIPVGDDPVEFALDAERGHIFLTCMEDVSTFSSDPSRRGSVQVIDYQSNSVVKAIYTGYQPHGLAVDLAAGFLVVANRNVSVGGPAPHHSSNCGTRNGNLALIDLNTLELVQGYKPELSADPYTVAVKQ
jgi:DNA-binding beta-propeller fold protein YncE